MADNSEKLIRKRGSVKAKVTIFEKYLANLEQRYSDFMISDQNVFLELEQRAERFQNILDDLKRLVRI